MTDTERPIRIAADLALPLEATTQTFAILAKRGKKPVFIGFSGIIETITRSGGAMLNTPSAMVTRHWRSDDMRTLPVSRLPRQESFLLNFEVRHAATS